MASQLPRPDLDAAVDFLYRFKALPFHLAAIPVEEARVIGERPVREAAYEPIRNNYWLILAGIALLVFVALVLRAFWLALGRSDAYDGEEMPGEAV